MRLAKRAARRIGSVIELIYGSDTPTLQVRQILLEAVKVNGKRRTLNGGETDCHRSLDELDRAANADYGAYEEEASDPSDGLVPSRGSPTTGMENDPLLHHCRR